VAFTCVPPVGLAHLDVSTTFQEAKVETVPTSEHLSRHATCDTHKLATVQHPPTVQHPRGVEVPAEEDQRQVQATVNIGVIGHVAHGKSTLVRQLTGVTTGKSSVEAKRNCTVHLGYANFKIWCCPNCGAHAHTPSAPRSHPCTHDSCHGVAMTLLRHVSLVDCPGHDAFISTMVNGTAVMDAAILVVAANEVCPQPQTVEHLAAAELLGVGRFVVAQNKVDLCGDSKTAHAQAHTIKSFLKGTTVEDAPLLPVVAQAGLNIDALVEALEGVMPPERPVSSIASEDLRMSIVRTFKVTPPGCTPSKLCGGVLGGSISQGQAEIGNLLEIRPGVVNSKGGARPLFTAITGLKSEATTLHRAVPGGLIGVGTGIDPMLCMSDRLVGHIVGAPGTLPPVWRKLQTSFSPIRLRDTTGKQAKAKLTKNSSISVHIGALQRNAVITKVGKHKQSDKIGRLMLGLDGPVCADVGQRVTLFNGSKLIGHGCIQGGDEVELPPPPSLALLSEIREAALEEARVAEEKRQQKEETRQKEEARKQAAQAKKVAEQGVKRPKKTAKSNGDSRPDGRTKPRGDIAKSWAEDAWCDPAVLFKASKKKKRKLDGDTTLSRQVAEEVCEALQSPGLSAEVTAEAAPAAVLDVEDTKVAEMTEATAEASETQPPKKKKKKPAADTGSGTASAALGASSEAPAASMQLPESEHPVTDSNLPALDATAAGSKKKKKGQSAAEPLPPPSLESETPSSDNKLPQADTSDAALLAMDSHAAAVHMVDCRPAESCSFYPAAFPEQGDIIVATVARITDMGVHVTLPEYAHAPAFIPLRELSRKNRLPNVRALVPLGSDVVCSVSQLDADLKTVDLSKARVTKEEQAEALQRYRSGRTAHSILQRAAQLVDQPLATIYQTVGYPLLERFPTVYAAFQSALRKPDVVFPLAQQKTPEEPLQPEAAWQWATLQEVRRRTSPPPPEVWGGGGCEVLRPTRAGRCETCPDGHRSRSATRTRQWQDKRSCYPGGITPTVLAGCDHDRPRGSSTSPVAQCEAN